MNNENELLEPLATEAGQDRIVQAINNFSSLEYAVRAERAATNAAQSADEASNSAEDASDSATEARNWATKTNGYVAQETITIPPEQEGDEPTTETIDLYSARYYAALAQDIYNNLQFDTEPTENSTALVSSGAIYTALNSKADKSDTYTKTEVDTALGNVQSTLTFDNVPTANSDNPVKSSGIKTALDGKQDNLTFDSTPTANSTNPVTSGGVYTALQNVNIDIDDEITEDSDNPVTSAAIYEALQNFTPSGGGSGGAGNASGITINKLYSGNSTALSIGNELNLSHTWKDYDFIEFGVFPADGSLTKTNPYGETHIVSAKSIQDCYIANNNMRLGISVHNQGSTERYVSLRIFDTKFVVNTTNNNSKVCIEYIHGIKFSKNLSEQMYSNVLYENSSGGTTNTTITLNDSYENYDLFEILYKMPAWGNTSTIFCTKQQLGDTERPLLIFEDGKYVAITKTSTTSFTLGGSTGNNVINVCRITGIKLAKGGYSGIVSDARMTVKSGTYTNTNGWINDNDSGGQVTFDSPMPDTNYQVLISKNAEFGYTLGDLAVSSKTVNGFHITLWGRGNVSTPQKVDWIAIRPNSYTREGMVEDVLFSNTSGVNSGTINLSGNISDYDLIEIGYINYGSNSPKQVSSYFVSSSRILQSTNSSGRISMYMGGNAYIALLNVNDNSFKFSSSSGLSITKITGIKFGRYVSGVAVDTTVTQNSDAVVTSGAVYDALQNYTPSGGGSSITVDSTITQNGTNPVTGGAIYTALSGKADTSTTLSGYGITDAYTKTEVDTALSSKGDVTTNTDQNITGTKTFVGSKKVGFKQSAANDKLGFTLFGNTGTERGYLEFNPTNTIDGVAGLMTLGNYATSAGALTHVGFRRYSNISGASGAYNLLTPLIADAKAPFSLTTSYTNFYLPLGFTDGTTTVKTAKSGVVDLSPLLASLEARIAALEGN